MIRLINLRRLYLYFRGKAKYVAVITLCGGILGALVGIALLAGPTPARPKVFSVYYYSVTSLNEAIAAPSEEAYSVVTGSFFLANVAEDVFPGQSERDIVDRTGLPPEGVSASEGRVAALGRLLDISTQGNTILRIRIASPEEQLNTQIAESIDSQISDLRNTVFKGLNVMLLSSNVATQESGGSPASLPRALLQGAVVGLMLGFSFAVCAALFVYVFGRTAYVKEDFSEFLGLAEPMIDGPEQSDRYVAEASYALLSDNRIVIGVASSAGDDVSIGYAEIMRNALSEEGHRAAIWTPSEGEPSPPQDLLTRHDVVLVPIPDITVDPLVFRVGRDVAGVVMVEKTGVSDLVLFRKAIGTLERLQIPLFRVVVR